jgi:CCR4-NOT transcriptional regulation complex NOT5 subunit
MNIFVLIICLGDKFGTVSSSLMAPAASSYILLISTKTFLKVISAPLQTENVSLDNPETPMSEVTVPEPVHSASPQDIAVDSAPTSTNQSQSVQQPSQEHQRVFPLGGQYNRPRLNNRLAQRSRANSCASTNRP